MPDSNALLALALQEFQARRFGSAEQLCRQSLAHDPNSTDVRLHALLGTLLTGRKCFDEAAVSFERAAALNPTDLAIANNLAFALKHSGQTQRAIEVLQAALEHRPDAPELHFNLGLFLHDTRQLLEATNAFRRAIELRPEFVEAYINLGQTYRDLGLLGRAIEILEAALRIKPDYAKALTNLGVVLHESGRVAEGLECIRKGLELAPDQAQARSNLLYYLSYSPGIAPRAVYEAHERWNTEFALPLAKGAGPHLNNRDPDRRLRVGYVSANFHEHSVAFFLEPILAHHDKGKVEITCFSNSPLLDNFTRRFKSYADAWHDIHTLSDDQAARAIRAAGIDILVDLSVHTSGNRLLVFARKPAPVQISMLGYPQTTGLTAMDYRLSDAILDPVGAEAYNSERLLRMPRSYFCYRPPDESPAIAPRSALSPASICFGCFNTLAKFNRPTAELWSRILAATPDASLTLLARGLGDDRTREYVQGIIASAGIDLRRVRFLPGAPLRRYLELLGDIDIGLDPIPFSSGTTTCHTLWMGAPVISLAGDSPVARMGASVLANAGLSELVARTEDDYVLLATQLAKDAPRLASLRAGMRQRLLQSPLLDAAGYTRELESLYREVWREWSCSALA
jgi:protein O-GlcNAc transferase